MNVARKNSLLAILLLLLGACDEPAEYSMHVREFLVARGVSDRVIERLLMQAELSDDDIEGLREFENYSVLHLVAINPGTPHSMLAELATHEHVEVRAGVAANPETPQAILLRMRTPGSYSAVNDALSRNPRLPPEVLQEMYVNREASASGIAMNPNTPPDVLRAIARDGEELHRIWLAGNPNLPDDLVLQLAQDGSKVVRERLKNRQLPDLDGVVAVQGRDNRK